MSNRRRHVGNRVSLQHVIIGDWSVSRSPYRSSARACWRNASAVVSRRGLLWCFVGEPWSKHVFRSVWVEFVHHRARSAGGLLKVRPAYGRVHRLRSAVAPLARVRLCLLWEQRGLAGGGSLSVKTTKHGTYQSPLLFTSYATILTLTWTLHCHHVRSVRVG